jgi:hypothetical protein
MAGTTSILGPENEIEIYRGASKTFELHVTDAEEEDVDLTGARVIMSVKCDLSDPSPIFQKDSNAGASQIDITTPKEGKAEIKLVPSDTQTMDVGTYVFDIWVVLASGTRSPVVAPSPFKVVAGVTVLT